MTCNEKVHFTYLFENVEHMNINAKRRKNRASFALTGPKLGTGVWMFHCNGLAMFPTSRSRSDFNIFLIMRISFANSLRNLRRVFYHLTQGAQPTI